MMNYRSTHRVTDTSKLRELLGYRDVVPARKAVQLAAWWRSAIADPPDLGYAELPGFGKSYAGPGTRNVRARTRI
jgi:hypothetical protein